MEHILGWGDVSFFFVCWYAVAIILLIIALRVCLSTVTKNYLFKTQSQKKRKKSPPFF
jgi:heme exporter protein D